MVMRILRMVRKGKSPIAEKKVCVMSRQAMNLVRYVVVRKSGANRGIDLRNPKSSQIRVMKRIALTDAQVEK